MTRKVLSVSDWNNQYSCIRDTSKDEEYALYYHFNAINKDGYPTKRRKLIGRYPTMYHVLSVLKERCV